MPKCRNCKQPFEQVRFLQKYCLEEQCVKVWVEKAKEDAWKKKKQQFKKDNEKLSTLVQAAQIVFNQYIRLRDSGNVCISCRQPPKKENAGHYWNTHYHQAVRFDEDNVHLQCEHCNNSKHGDLANYQIYLIEKIGKERFDALQERAKKTRNYTRDEVQDVISRYKAKIKEIKK
jgi:hypothetical protein